MYIYIDMNKGNIKTLKEKTLVSSIDMKKRDLKTLKVPLLVRQFFCFWNLFVALNNCANFFALRQT